MKTFSDFCKSFQEYFSLGGFLTAGALFCIYTPEHEKQSRENAPQCPKL